MPANVLVKNFLPIILMISILKEYFENGHDVNCAQLRLIHVNQTTQEIDFKNLESALEYIEKIPIYLRLEEIIISIQPDFTEEITKTWKLQLPQPLTIMTHSSETFFLKFNTISSSFSIKGEFSILNARVSIGENTQGISIFEFVGLGKINFKVIFFKYYVSFLYDVYSQL